MGPVLPSYYTDPSYAKPHMPFTHMSVEQKILLGLSGLTIAMASAPFVLPAMGVGPLEQMIALDLCTVGTPTGLAGASADLLRQITVVGGTLAQGGLWNGVGAGAVAVAGTLAANHWQRKAENKTIYSWHGLLRAATLVTSALIAAPALLQALTMSTHYFTLLAGQQLYGDVNHFSDVLSFATNTIGKLGAEGASAGANALSASSALVPHILSCGVAAGVGSAAIHGTAHGAVNGAVHGSAQLPELPATVITPSPMQQSDKPFMPALLRARA